MDLGMDTVMHISVLSMTTILYFVLSSTVSPRLFRSWSHRTAADSHIKRHFRSCDYVPGYFLHALTVSFLSVFSLVSHWRDTNALQESTVAVISAEISLSFWVTDTLTSIVKDPGSTVRRKQEFAHHVSGIFCLVVALWYRGVAMEMSVVRLLSQLSAVLLVLRLLLLDLGMSDTLLYLLTFSAMILMHLLTRITPIPWYWIKLYVYVTETDAPLVTVGVLVVVSLCIDGLNLFWLRLMVRTYLKYYPEKYNPFKNY